MRTLGPILQEKESAQQLHRRQGKEEDQCEVQADRSEFEEENNEEEYDDWGYLMAMTEDEQTWVQPKKRVNAKVREIDITNEWYASSCPGRWNGTSVQSATESVPRQVQSETLDRSKLQE